MFEYMVKKKQGTEGESTQIRKYINNVQPDHKRPLSQYQVIPRHKSAKRNNRSKSRGNYSNLKSSSSTN